MEARWPQKPPPCIPYVSTTPEMAVRAVVLLVGALLLAVAAACAGQTYVHRRFRDVDFVAHNEVGGVMMTAVGTLYAVLLGFLTVVAWQHFAETQRDVTLEAAAGTDAWHAGVVFLRWNEAGCATTFFATPR